MPRKFAMYATKICLLLCVTTLAAAERTVGESTKYVIPDPLAKFGNDDFSELTTPLYVGGRVMDLMNGEHFDNILQDTPDAMRPPAIVLFYDPSDAQCQAVVNQLDFTDNVQFKLPSRAFLYAAKYDMNAAPKRTWYKWIPERDLARRFGVTQCPSLVFVPPKCNGHTEWCVRDTIDGVQYLGCEEFVEQCADWRIYGGDFHNDDWLQWVEQMMANTSAPQLGGSRPGHVFGAFKEQERWIKGRDGTTTQTQLRNNWAAATLPAFSERGYKAMAMPDDLLREYVNFYVKYRGEKADENWNSNGQTQVNGHEVAPYMTSLDKDMALRDRIAQNFIKPMLEEWVGFPLQLTSHYGEREYYSGSWLRNHIDRMDVLVISATSSILHLTKNDTANFDGSFLNSWPDEFKGQWPLEGVDWQGNNVRYSHEPGTIVLYESAKFVHGRPYPLPGQDLLHVGAFCHFIPADGTWAQNGHAVNARNNINRHTQNVRYTKEPLYYPPKNRHHEDHVDKEEL